MPLHAFDPPRGRLETLTLDSRALAGNLLGDPATRSVAVYLPPRYDEVDQDYPLLVGLAGFTGSGLRMVGWQGFGESVPQRLDRLNAEGAMGPVVAAFPDGFTSLGGNQYVNSPVTGRWEDFLLEELVPELEERYRVRPGATHRAVFGKSSGGYGALVQGLRHGQRWAAVACHSGDMAFDLVYGRELPQALDVLARHGRDIARFVKHLREARKIKGDEMTALMLLAMAATYDPDPAAPIGARLPVDLSTCEWIEERWRAWLAHDPVQMIEREECQASLRRLLALYLDCGSRDPYALHYGARRFVRKLEAAGIAHVYEEFDDDHSGLDYRLDRSLPLLYQATS